MPLKDEEFGRLGRVGPGGDRHTEISPMQQPGLHLAK